MSMTYEKVTERAIHAINKDDKYIGSIRLHENGWRLTPIEHHAYEANELLELAEKLKELYEASHE